MNSSKKVSEKNLNTFIDGFISSQVTGRGLDARTEKAYRLDLEHFYRWLKTREAVDSGEQLSADAAVWQRSVEQYLSWLSQEKRLRSSTISRKCRVFGYFLAYLAREGILSGTNPAVPKTEVPEEKMQTTYACASKPSGLKRAETRVGTLSRTEVDAFFQAIRRETEDVDSDFRRRICLRDHVIMGLLFYHGIEISELLKMDVSNYDRKSGILTIRKKRGKEYSVRLFSKELREHMNRWLEEHEYFEHNEEFRSWMFLSKLGRPLSMKMVILIFEKYRALAGIEKECTPKDLKNGLGRYGIELAMERCE